MYLIIKNIHVTFATLTIVGFVLRAYWRMNGSTRRRVTPSELIQ